jgi:predicted GNAT superfamily acetyltransferase
MTDTKLILNVGDEITLRRAESIADYRACQKAQEQAWGIAEAGYLIPIATMVGANLHGGLVLGAFLPSGEAVAMSFAFLARVEGDLCLYSQLTGVVPSHQSRGLGYRIKQLQRQIAHAEGIEQICWAFDPLQAGNASFNLARLGASAVRFVENMYGDRTDPLNAGAPTDRVIAQWDTVGSPPIVLPAGAVRDLPRLIETAEDEEEAPGTRAPVPAETVEAEPPDSSSLIPTGAVAGEPPCTRALAPTGVISVSSIGEPLLLLEIPDDIALLRRNHSALAERWQGAVSQAFRLAFEASYRAVHFVQDESTERRRSFYLLERL